VRIANAAKIQVIVEIALTAYLARIVKIVCDAETVLIALTAMDWSA
jgi:hypothetical protein